IMSKYKTIVLQQGLEDVAVDDYLFRRIKSLLRKELNLTEKMQNDYDRIQMADLLEDIFPKDAGLDKLIEVCQSIKDLEELAQRLKTERAKGNMGAPWTLITSPPSPNFLECQCPRSLRNRTCLCPGFFDFSGTSTNNIQQSSSSSGFHTNRNKRSPDHSNTSRMHHSRASRSSIQHWTEGHHRDPIQVMVLKVTEPFTYDLIDGKRMFHATVATETEFFRVKVFDTALKNKFIPQKIIAISDYFGTSGFLEIYGASCVSDVNVNQTMVISNTLRRRANGTPKIKDLFSQTKGTYVNGEFVVTKKNERGDFIHYGIEDDTGKMEVVVYGRLTSINCEPGNKLRLVCFELTSREDTWQLKSVRHSYILKTVPKQPSEEEGHHQGPKKVMVLKATEPFTYDNRGERWMFHATVATETEFFRVKVFDIDLKEKFIPNNVITISDYVGRNGFINIHSASSVSEVNDNQLMNIPTTLRQRANATPKINDLYSQRRGIFVNGVFMVSKKNEREDFIYYEIQDNTGVMEVVVYGRLTSVDCNPGDKLRLWCFELTSNEDRVQLRSTRHSNMKVCALGEHPPS
uniref:Uncharacterized protein n=1 Tax=Peromyscus maniculatus bairdii TaxID=230844 RepID=A0A8C8US74_PERMB